MIMQNRITPEHVKSECLLTIEQLQKALKYLKIRNVNQDMIRTYSSRGILEGPRLGPPTDNVRGSRFKSYYKPSAVLEIVEIRIKLAEGWTIDRMRFKTNKNRSIHQKLRIIDRDILEGSLEFIPLLDHNPRNRRPSPIKYQDLKRKLLRLVRKKNELEQDIENNKFGKYIDPVYKTMLGEYLNDEFGKDCSKSLENL